MGRSPPSDIGEYRILTEAAGAELKQELFFICANSDDGRKPLAENISAGARAQPAISRQSGETRFLATPGENLPDATLETEDVGLPLVTEIHIERPTFERVQMNVRAPHECLEEASSENWEDGIPIDSSLDCSLDHNLYRSEGDRIIQLHEVNGQCKQFVNDILDIVESVQHLREDTEADLTVSEDALAGGYCHEGEMTFCMSVYLEDDPEEDVVEVPVSV